MGIVEKLNEDKAYIINEIENLDDVYLKNKRLGELRQINAILNSNVIPRHYKSFVTEEIFSASDDELSQIPNIPKEKHVTFCTKQSRKDNPHLQNSIFTLHRRNAQEIARFSPEHKPDKQYLSGGISKKIKKAINLETNELLALKVFRDNVGGSLRHRHRMALRNAVCNRFLGRKSYGFLRSKDRALSAYLIAPWLGESALVDINIPYILTQSIEYRIMLALSLLDEIKILHEAGIVNLDIKPDNVMIHQGLTLFDFDSVRNINEVIPDRHELIYTPKYIPLRTFEILSSNYEKKYLYLNADTDIVAACRTLIETLFLDLFDVRYFKLEPGHLFERRREIEQLAIEAKQDIDPVHLPLQQLLHNTLLEAEYSALNVEENPEAPRNLKVIDFYKELRSLLIDHYHNTSYENPHDSDILQHYRLFVTGETAFDEIEAELVSYMQREQIAQASMPTLNRS